MIKRIENIGFLDCSVQQRDILRLSMTFGKSQITFKCSSSDYNNICTNIAKICEKFKIYSLIIMPIIIEYHSMIYSLMLKNKKIPVLKKSINVFTSLNIRVKIKKYIKENNISLQQDIKVHNIFDNSNNFKLFLKAIGLPHSPNVLSLPSVPFRYLSKFNVENIIDVDNLQEQLRQLPHVVVNQFIDNCERNNESYVILSWNNRYGCYLVKLTNRNEFYKYPDKYGILDFIDKKYRFVMTHSDEYWDIDDGLDLNAVARNIINLKRQNECTSLIVLPNVFNYRSKLVPKIERYTVIENKSIFCYDEIVRRVEKYLKTENVKYVPKFDTIKNYQIVQSKDQYVRNILTSVNNCKLFLKSYNIDYSTNFMIKQNHIVISPKTRTRRLVELTPIDKRSKQQIKKKCACFENIDIVPWKNNILVIDRNIKQAISINFHHNYMYDQKYLIKLLRDPHTDKEVKRLLKKIRSNKWIESLENSQLGMEIYNIQKQILDSLIPSTAQLKLHFTKRGSAVLMRRLYEYVKQRYLNENKAKFTENHYKRYEHIHYVVGYTYKTISIINMILDIYVYLNDIRSEVIRGEKPLSYKAMFSATCSLKFNNVKN